VLTISFISFIIIPVLLFTSNVYYLSLTSKVYSCLFPVLLISQFYYLPVMSIISVLPVTSILAYSQFHYYPSFIIYQ